MNEARQKDHQFPDLVVKKHEISYIRNTKKGMLYSNLMHTPLLGKNPGPPLLNLPCKIRALSSPNQFSGNTKYKSSPVPPGNM